jgi:hypothetical protein
MGSIRSGGSPPHKEEKSLVSVHIPYINGVLEEFKRIDYGFVIT